MPPDLTSVNLKLSRAEEHFQTLKSEIFAYFHHRPYTYITKVNEDATRYSIFIKKSSCEPPLQRWALLTGDCIHNLRSALDHLIYEIAFDKLTTMSLDDEARLAFPISAKPNSLPSFRGKFDSEVLYDSVWAAIKSVQPDIRKHPDLPDEKFPLLLTLSNLDNYDKHRLVKTAIASPEQYDIGFDYASATPKITGKIFTDTFYGELKDGTEIYAVILPRPTLNVKYDRINLLFAFSVWHGSCNPGDLRQWLNRSNVLTLLMELRREVDEVIGIVLSSIPVK